MKEYSIKSGFPDRRRKLILTEDYLEWENGELKGNEFTRLNKSDHLDFKHGTDWIVWYKLTVGRRFSITIKSKAGKELKIRFNSYFGRNENDRKYSQIVNDIWSFCHSDVVNKILDTFYERGEVEVDGFRLNAEGINLREGKGLVPWDKVITKEYYRYFAIHHLDNPVMHSSVSYNEYGTETLWSVIRTILKERG